MNGDDIVLQRTDRSDVDDVEQPPVTPERSSTGAYSGGEPRSGTLDAKDEKELWRRVKALEADEASHAEERAKGTGAFRVTEAGATREFKVDAGKPLRSFDAFLKKL